MERDVLIKRLDTLAQEAHDNGYPMTAVTLYALCGALHAHYDHELAAYLRVWLDAEHKRLMALFN